MLHGIDLASHQGADYNFALAKRQGRDFVVIKATGGHTYQNEALARQVANARAAGLHVGFYHYMFEPTVGGGDLLREVDNFVAATKPYAQPGTTFWLDVEEYPESVGFRGDFAQWLLDFIHFVNAAFGCKCGIYCGTYFLQKMGLQGDTRFADIPFWIASWQPTVPALVYARPFNNITLWQDDAYTMVAGRQTDTDTFFGTLQDLEALGVPYEVETLADKIAKAVEVTRGERRADGQMSPVSVTLEDPAEPGVGIPYKAAVWVYNADEGKHYLKEWELGAYKPWRLLG